jgi:hypothetical protein
MRNRPEITNAMRERFMAFMNNDVMQEYKRAARIIGEDIGADTVLTPLVQSESTVIRTTTATHPDTPVSLNADFPEQQLRFYFQDPAFIRRITATVTAPVLTADALAGATAVPVPPFEPQVFTTQPFVDIDAADFIYVQFERDGSGQVYQSRPMPLSEFSGNGSDSYFFNLIPVMPKAGSMLVTVSILPPNNRNFDNPPFVDRVGMVTISLHTERFNPFGV